jgi:hypothetical protein
VKKLASLLAILVLLIVSTGAVSSDKPEDYITITGYTTYADFGPLPKERTWFYVTAHGGGDDIMDAMYDPYCQSVAGQPCGVVGSIGGASFIGEFTFEEWGEGKVKDFVTFEGSGKNSGIVTIIDANNRLLVRFEFDGKFDTDRSSSESVWGKWEAKHPNPNLKGHGDYTGTVGLVFSVTFTGKFKD